MSSNRLVYVTKLLLFGYCAKIEKYLNNTIPSSIIDLLFSFYYISPNSFQWKIRDKKLLRKIQNAPNGISFNSEQYTIQGLNWHFKLYPNGVNEETKGICQLFLMIVNSHGEATTSIKRTITFYESNTIYEDSMDYSTYMIKKFNNSANYMDFAMKVGLQYPINVLNTKDISKYQTLTFIAEITVLFHGDKTNLIVNYLPLTMSEGTLATLFSPYGLLERCKIVYDIPTRQSRGYGFVKFNNVIAAERAINALNGYEIKGKRLKVSFARQKSKEIQNTNLYVANLPKNYTEQYLQHLFSNYGQIVECRILRNQINGQSRGVGFVRMDTHNHALQAIQAMNQYRVDNKYPPLIVRLAERKTARKLDQTQHRNEHIMRGNRRYNNNSYQRQNRGGMGRGQRNRNYHNNQQYYSQQGRRGNQRNVY